MGFRDNSPIALPNSAALSRYRRVVITSSVLALADAATPCLGTLDRATQTSDAQAAVRLRTTDGTLVMVASGAVTQFAKVYADASGKVTATANGVLEGIALQAATADGDEIEVLPLGNTNGSGRLFAQVAASSNITNSTVETAFSQSFTIPANFLKAGDILRIRGQAIAPTTNSTDTLTLKLKIGTTIIAATAAVDVADGDVGFFDATVVIRTAGASGTLVATGVQGLGVPGTATARPFLLGSTAVDTTATQLVSITATWSVASASDIVRLDNLVIERQAA